MAETILSSPPASVQCEACGANFPRPKSGRAKFCRPCARERHVLVKKLSYARRKGCSVPGEGTTTCTACGETTHKVRANKKYCEKCSVQARKRARQRWSLKRPDYRKPLGGYEHCADCGVSFPERSERRYCGGCSEIRAEKGESFWYWRASGGKAQSVGAAMVCGVCGTEAVQRRIGQKTCGSARCKAEQCRRTAGVRGRIANQMRCYINRALRGEKKGRSWQRLVGYSLEELMEHLERQFLPGMTWENRGKKWHVDHIRPLSSFSYSTAECPQFREAWALTNLRPLWARDNQRKHAKRVFLI